MARAGNEAPVLTPRRALPAQNSKTIFKLTHYRIKGERSKNPSRAGLSFPSSLILNALQNPIFDHGIGLDSL
jgi:hypothetical protein